LPLRTGKGEAWSTPGRFGSYSGGELFSLKCREKGRVGTGKGYFLVSDRLVLGVQVAAWFPGHWVAVEASAISGWILWGNSYLG